MKGIFRGCSFREVPQRKILRILKKKKKNGTETKIMEEEITCELPRKISPLNAKSMQCP